MKILKNLAKAIEDMMEKYNEYVSEDKMMDWAAYIDAAIASALEEYHTDWSKAGHLDYLDKSWSLVKEYPSKNVYHQIMTKVAFDKAITFDDAMCFICKNYLVRFELMAKKARLDTTWDGDNVLIALYACGQLTDGVSVEDDKIRMTCPNCGHPDFWLYYDSRIADCYTGSCIYRRGNSNDIWDILTGGNIDNFASAIHNVYKAVVDDHAASMEMIDELDYTVCHTKRSSNGSKGYDNTNIPKIMAALKPEYGYMYQYGFTKNDLEEFDCVGFRDDSVADRCNESNLFRHRLCWAVKDIEGKIVGLQGRSVLSDSERSDFVDNDNHTSPQDFKKAKCKVLNTAGFAKSQHLYLLYKYVQDAGEYNKLVITEGIKDAMRIAQIHCPDVAVVSSFGCNLSDRQVELIKQVFDKDIIIELAYDGDMAGFLGNLDSARKLKEAGYKNIRFVLYRAKSKTDYYKDFGDVLISYLPKRNEFIHLMLTGVREDVYIQAAKERGFYSEPPKKTVIKKRIKQQVERTTDDIGDKLKRYIVEMLRAKKQAAAGRIAV